MNAGSSYHMLKNVFGLIPLKSDGDGKTLGACMLLLPNILICVMKEMHGKYGLK